LAVRAARGHLTVTVSDLLAFSSVISDTVHPFIHELDATQRFQVNGPGTSFSALRVSFFMGVGRGPTRDTLLSQGPKNSVLAFITDSPDQGSFITATGTKVQYEGAIEYFSHGYHFDSAQSEIEPGQTIKF
jgi:hypothetical protein